VYTTRKNFIINKTGDENMDAWKKTVGWGLRKGLTQEQAEDFSNYYANPRGWYSGPESSVALAPIEKIARKLGIKVSEDALSKVVENMAFGEKRGHRIAAMNHWAQRKGVSPQEAKEFAELVENRFYGNPETHRRAALTGWRRQRLAENPLWPPLLPEPYQASLGLAEMEADAPHIVGALLGLGTTGLYAGVGELASKNDWIGTGVGLGMGLAQSEMTRRWFPGIGTTTEAELIKQRAGFARGQRLAVYSVSGIRCVTSLVKMAAGVGTQKGALAQGIDDIGKRIKEGKILDAVRLPFVTGFGFHGLGAAIDEIEWPKLPESFPQLGADWKWPKLGQNWPQLPEGIKKLFEKREKKSEKKEPSPKAGDAPAISAGNKESPAISAGDEVEYPAITQGATEIGLS
jgi:hypothetical protein